MQKLSITTARRGAVVAQTNHRSSLATRFFLAASLMLLASGGLWLSGFSSQSNAHNAAHDTRHGLNFPCH